jgi:hypothetical protein
LLAQGLFGEHHSAVGGIAVSGSHGAGATSARRAAHRRPSIQNFGHGRYSNGYWNYYEPFYDFGYVPAAGTGETNTTVVYPTPGPAVLAKETVHPVIHEYGQPGDYGPPPMAEGHPILYLIAFRDSTIRAVTTYWVEGGTLHYLDSSQSEKRAPLTSVDRDLSVQLNRERRVPFNLQ